MKTHSHLHRTGHIFILGGLLAIILIVISPIAQPIPGRDSGVFLYTGKIILEGGIPYRDSWDNKPPGVHFINALGLWLGQGSRWGVWTLEMAWLIGSILLGYLLLKKEFGFSLALFGSAAWLVSFLLLMEGGNLTEEYALLFQFSSLLLFWHSEKQNHYGWRGYATGLCSAACFLLRQNLIGVGLSISIYILLNRISQKLWLRLLQELTTITVGAATLISLVTLYFLAHKGLLLFWDQAFHYNLIYTQGTFIDRLKILAESLRIVAPSGIGILAITGWLGAAWIMIRQLDWVKDRMPLVGLALIGLPIEFLLSMGGRLYPHYYLAWLPIASILASLFAAAIFEGHLTQSTQAPPSISTPTVWLSALLIAMGLLPVGRTLYQRATNDPTRSAMVEYLRTETREGEYVLVWGNEPVIHFLSNRPCPTRYSGQYGLYTPGYERSDFIFQFLQDLKTHPPRLIMDSSKGNALVPPIDLSLRVGWLTQRGNPLLPEFNEVWAFIDSRYQHIDTVQGWDIYRLQEQSVS